jgi:DNA-nicking Smr family endonuclease
VKRRLGPEEVRLWRTVAATVRPSAGRSPPPEPEAPARPAPAAPAPRASAPAPAHPASPPRKPSARLHGIEPNRERRIVRGREEIGARIDLHGLDQDQARAAVTAFLLRAQAEGCRAALVITGRGRLGGGVLKRRLPDWLSEAPLRAAVAGFSTAHRRHGGEGAFYVALKRPRS